MPYVDVTIAGIPVTLGKIKVKDFIANVLPKATNSDVAVLRTAYRFYRSSEAALVLKFNIAKDAGKKRPKGYNARKHWAAEGHKACLKFGKAMVVAVEPLGVLLEKAEAYAMVSSAEVPVELTALEQAIIDMAKASNIDLAKLASL